jgi:hypothetical protein
MTPEDNDRRKAPRRADDADPRGIVFDKTINLGHILTMASMIGAVMVSWSLMDKRVVVLEEARQAQRDRDQAQDAANRDKFGEVRDALIDLRRSVEKVSDKVGAK